ncbi:MAG: hypothetical protein K2X38_25360, partial [Gemmataceae bacterium]|nr:hypothetical protein [Gemmataceae bacterium]
PLNPGLAPDGRQPWALLENAFSVRGPSARTYCRTPAVHGMKYLLTWNCTHIANVVLRPQIEEVCRAAGYEAPLICTPEELAPGDFP